MRARNPPCCRRHSLTCTSGKIRDALISTFQIQVFLVAAPGAGVTSFTIILAKVPCWGFQNFPIFILCEWLDSRSLASHDPVGLAPELWYCRPTDAVDGVDLLDSLEGFCYFIIGQTDEFGVSTLSQSGIFGFPTSGELALAATSSSDCWPPATMLSDTLALSSWWSVLTISAILSSNAPSWQLSHQCQW